MVFGKVFNCPKDEKLKIVMLVYLVLERWWLKICTLLLVNLPRDDFHFGYKQKKILKKH